MALKHRDREETSLSPTQRPWGELAEPGKTATVVRFVLDRRAVSLPVHALKFWEFEEGPPELLRVHADIGVVTIQGRGLGALHDALDSGKLASVRATPGRNLPDTSVPTFVSAVSFQPKAPSPDPNSPNRVP